MSRALADAPAAAVKDKAPGTTRVIVWDGVTDAFLRDLAAAVPSKVVYRYKIIDGAAVAVREADVARAIAFSVSRHVKAREDLVVHTSLSSATKTTHVKASGPGSPGAWALGYTGKGVTIADIDTGIRGTHKALDDLDDVAGTTDPKILKFLDFVNASGGEVAPYDDNNHGTHTSGVAAGTGEGSPTPPAVGDGPRGHSHVGVAYEANLVGLKVLDNLGTGSGSDSIAAIDWVWKNKDSVFPPVRVINISFGGIVPGGNNGTSPEDLAIDTASAAGIVSVIAAGNGTCDGGCDNQPNGGNIAVPGDSATAITVCSSNSAAPPTNPTFTTWDSQGPTADGRIKPDVCAPGESVTAPTTTNDTAYSALGGTSFSTPNVAGIAALLLQAVPSMTAAQVKESITQTASHAATGQNNDSGWGEAFAREAILYACSHFGVGNTCSPSPLVVQANGPYYALQGRALKLHASATGGTAPYRFDWDLDNDGAFDDVVGRSDATFTDTSTPGVTRTVRVRATDAASSPATQTDTTTVTVSPEHAVFSDNVEGGTNGWTSTSWGAQTAAGWHRQSAHANGPGNAWYEGSDAAQTYSSEETVDLAKAIDLSTAQGQTLLRFAMSGDFEKTFDFLHVMTRRPSGAWAELAKYDDTSATAWTTKTVDISDYRGGVAEIGFRFTSDDFNDPTVSPVPTGPYIDDIRIVSATIPGTDTTTPAAITDLAASSPTATSIQLAWTATGDDGLTGTASSYDLRRSTTAITDANFALATPVSGLPGPKAAGQPETFTVAGLNPSTQYFFAIKASDEAGNLSAISNVTSETTSSADVTPPSKVSGLVATSLDRRIDLAWSAATDDVGVDHYVVRRNGTDIAHPAATSHPDTGLANGTAYTYTVSAVDAAGNEGPQSDPVTATPGALDPQLVVYPDKLNHNGAEPSMGVSWTTGHALFQSGMSTTRTDFDTANAPQDTWYDVSYPNDVFTPLQDPIGFLDTTTGRYFNAQIAGDCSQMGFTDDEGAHWTPSAGCGPGSGHDHETVGGGPFPPGLSPTTSYPNAVWYCAQNNVGATCALSRDGGQTFDPAKQIYTSAGFAGMTCGGLHGHVRVAPATSTKVPKGTTVVPAKSCGGTKGGAITTDGVNWKVIHVSGTKVGGSGNAEFDPSASFASDGTLYYGMCNPDSATQRLPMVAISNDGAASFSTPVDVGTAPAWTGPRIQNCEFAEMIAGDANRAAFAFLGSPQAGNDQNVAVNGFNAVWHLFVSFTYDGGATWKTIDATPNDPVQKGCINAGGTTQTTCRNLLDFNDIVIDRQGMVAVAYTDGCIATCAATNTPGDFNANSGTALSTIAYQRWGKGLFAAFDGTVPGAPALSATAGSGRVLLAWSAPPDGGSRIGRYTLARTPPFASPVTLDQSTTRYVDASAVNGTAYTYTITAVSGAGSATSAPVAVTPGAEANAPSRVVGLAVADAREAALALTWDAATDDVGVDHYVIRRDGTQVATAPATSYADSRLTNGARYTYTVAAVDTSGNEGTASAAVSGIPTENVYGTFLLADKPFDQGAGPAAADALRVGMSRDASYLRLWIQLRDALAASNATYPAVEYVLQFRVNGVGYVALVDLVPGGQFTRCAIFRDAGPAGVVPFNASCGLHGNTMEMPIPRFALAPFQDGDTILFTGPNTRSRSVAFGGVSPAAASFDFFPDDPAGVATYTPGAPDSNNAPEWDDVADQTGAEDAALQFTVHATHQSAVVSYHAASLPAGATLDEYTGVFSWTPAFDQAGSYTVTLTANTGPGTPEATKDVLITIANIDRAPVFDPIGDKAVREGDALAFTVHAVDPDGDPIAYGAGNLPSGASFDPASATFSWTPAADQAGTYPGVRFSASDGSLTSSNDITITVANVPAAPVITGPSANALLNTSDVTVTGTADAGTTIEVLENGSVLATTTANSPWSVTVQIAEGDHSITARAIDAGNAGPESAAVAFTVDLTAPAAPVIVAPAHGSAIASASVAIVGTAEPQSTVTVSEGPEELGTAVADPAGNWNVTSSFADGPHTVTATSTDAAVNTSAASAPVTFTVDTTPPARPVITAPADGSVVGEGATNISGTADFDVTVHVFEGVTELAQTVSDGGGHWSTPVTFADGSHTIVATASDALGNTSGPSSPATFTVDSSVPPAPVITAPAAGAVVGSTTVAVQGTAESGTAITVLENGVVIATTEANSPWSVDVTFAEGSHTIVAKATDPAGHVSGASAPVSFTIDVTPPAPPAITSPVTGAVLGSATVPVAGTAEAGATVRLFEADTELAHATADPSGHWSASLTRPDGSHTIRATATDIAGNVSGDSAPVTFTVDTTAPGRPVINAPAENALLASHAVAVTGTAEPGAAVTVGEGPSVLGTGTASGTGAYSIDVTLADGSHTITATAKDVAGNVSPPSLPRRFAVDTTPPAPAAILTPSEGQTLPSAAVAFSGSAEPGSTVRVYEDLTQIAVGVTDPAGSWGAAATLADGSHTVTAKATDAAGNTGPASTPRTFVVDTTAPDAPTVTFAQPVITQTESKSVTLGGTRPPLTTIRVRVTDLVADTPDVLTTVAAGSGAWATVPIDLSQLALGRLDATAVAVDAFGRESVAATATARKVPDAPGPVAPRVEIRDTDGIVSPAGEDVKTVPVVVTNLEPAAGSYTLTISDGTTTRTKTLPALEVDVPTSVAVDFSPFVDGTVTASARAGEGPAGSDTTIVDQNPPKSTFGSSSSVCIVIPILNITNCSLSGSSTDAATGLQFVYISGVNEDTGEQFGHTAVLDEPGERTSTWKQSGSALALNPGRWTFHAQAQDEAGNFEPESSNSISVTIL